jgi:hypothetical protein
LTSERRELRGAVSVRHVAVAGVANRLAGQQRASL